MTHVQWKVYVTRKKVTIATMKLAISFLTGYDGSCLLAFLVFAVSNRSRFFMYVERMEDTAMPERMHMTGASTSIRRTITPCRAEQEQNQQPA